MKWKRIMDNSIELNKVVDRYESGKYLIKLEYGSLTSNKPSGFTLYQDEKYIDTFITLKEAKELAEQMEK